MAAECSGLLGSTELSGRLQLWAPASQVLLTCQVPWAKPSRPVSPSSPGLPGEGLLWAWADTIDCREGGWAKRVRCSGPRGPGPPPAALGGHGLWHPLLPVPHAALGGRRSRARLSCLPPVTVCAGDRGPLRGTAWGADTVGRLQLRSRQEAALGNLACSTQTRACPRPVGSRPRRFPHAFWFQGSVRVETSGAS